MASSTIRLSRRFCFFHRRGGRDGRGSDYLDRYASAIKVHRALGPGLLESAYRNGLAHDLRLKKLRIEVEKTLPLIYEGIRTNKGYRLDIFVEKRVVVEVKAAKAILPIDLSQMQTYLTLTETQAGLIINFNVRWLKEGIKRVIRRPPL